MTIDIDALKEAVEHPGDPASITALLDGARLVLAAVPAKDAVEAAAEALWQAESVRAADRRRVVEWLDIAEEDRVKWRFMARAALIAAGVHGRANAEQSPEWRTVPVKPTQQMLNAAIEAVGRDDEVENIADFVLRESWRAMLEAAPPPGGQTS